MVRTVIGILFSIIGVPLLLIGVWKSFVPTKNSYSEPSEIFLIMGGIYAGLGLGLWIWGLRAVRAKKLYKSLAEAFAVDGKSESTNAPTVADTAGLSEGERMIAQLIPENVERRYYQRGQVAAVTDRRLLFLLPRRAMGARQLECHYTIKSINVSAVRQVSQRKVIALGGLLVGIILTAIAVAVAIGGLTGQLIGPGVIFIPLTAGPFGLALVFGIRRRAITFSTPYGELLWRSGPMEVAKTAPLAKQVRDHFQALQVPVIGFE